MAADLSRVIKKYSNGEVTIVWKPSMCIHSKKCFTGLPGVFDPAKRPWIEPKGADTEKIIRQVKECPSGALSYFMNSEADKTEINISENNSNYQETIIEAKPNGPLLVNGNILIKKSDGTIEKRNKAAFCRCGNSNNKPFCDGSHVKAEFKG